MLKLQKEMSNVVTTQEMSNVVATEVMSNVVKTAGKISYNYRRICLML